MAKNTSISLSDHFNRFIEEQVGSGRYGSASDVMRAALRLLEEHEQGLAQLRSAIDEGEKSGFTEGFDVEEFLRDQHGGLEADEPPRRARR